MLKKKINMEKVHANRFAQFLKKNSRKFKKLRKRGHAEYAKLRNLIV